MIFGNSTDPVELKRVPIKIWSLKDEIQHALQIRLEQTTDLNNVDISDIKDFYIKTPLELKEAQDGQATAVGELDASEDEMAAAMAEEEAGAAPTEAPAEEEKQEEASEELKTEDAQASAPEGSESSDGAEKTDATTKKQYERIKPPDTVSCSGFSLLTDLNMTGILFFAKHAFTPGQSIVISFEIPHGFIISAEVVKCFDYETKSRIISEIKPGHRIQAKFTFLGLGERTKLREFIQSFTPTLPAKADAASKEEPASEGSDA